MFFIANVLHYVLGDTYDGPVACGSTIKLIHKETKHHLHSHSIAWGSGSGQQSVTSTGSNNDPGSMWIIKESFRGENCETGQPIKCGDVIRLEHMSTGKNLHSHLFKASLSGNQEVSGYGDGDNGDTGDNWKVVCETKDTYWTRGAPVVFQHVDTGKYLFSADTVKFNQGNCGMNCPIMGQNEVSASAKKDVKNRWVAAQGVYVTPIGKRSNNADGDYDDEL